MWKILKNKVSFLIFKSMTFNLSEKSRIKWAAIEVCGSPKLNLPRVFHQSAWENLTFPHYSFITKCCALRGDQWEHIKALLPERAGTVGVTAKDNRLFVETVLLISFGYSVQRSTLPQSWSGLIDDIHLAFLDCSLCK